MKRENNAVDPVTGLKFEKRRSNQKFESTKSKNKFHNKKAKEIRNKYDKYIKPILKNLTLLDKWLLNKNEVEIGSEFMKGAGYNFNSCTGKVLDSNNIIHNTIGPYVLINENSTTVKIDRYE